MGLYDGYKPEKAVIKPDIKPTENKKGGLYANYQPEKADVPKLTEEQRIQKNLELAKQQGLDEGKTVDLSPQMYELAATSAVPLLKATKLAMPAKLAIQGATGGLVQSGMQKIQGKNPDVLGNVLGGTILNTAIGIPAHFLMKGLPKVKNVASNVAENKTVQDLGELATNPQKYVAKIPTASEAMITEQPIKELATSTPQNKVFDIGLQADEAMPYADGGILPPMKNPPVLTAIGNELPTPQNTALVPESMANGGGNIPPQKPPVNTETPFELPMNQGETSPTEFINQGEHVGQKVRQGYTTVKDSAFGQDEAFMNSVEGSKMYDTITNKDTLKKAMDLSKEEADKILSSKDPSALRTMTNFLKLGQALSAEDRIAAETLGNMYIKRGTDIAQEQQARSIVKKLSPEGAVLTMIRVNRESTPKLAQNLIDNADDVINRPELINDIIQNAPKKLKEKILKSAKDGTLSKEKYLSEVDKFYKTKGITAEDIKKAKELTDKIKSSTGREQEIAIGQLRALIASKKPVSLGRKISTVQTMAQLMNPKTITRNILGNQIYQGLENVTQVPAVGIDKLVSNLTGNRSIAMPNIKTQLVEGGKGAKNALEDIMLGIDTTGNSKFDLYPTNSFKNPVMNTLEKAMSMSLRVPDRFAYEGAKADIINGFKQLGNKITPELEAYAEELARKKTFQDDSALAKMTQGFKENLNLGQDWGLGDLLIKYAKTPANLVSRGLSYSPVGAVKGGAELASLLKTGQVGDLVGVAAQNKAVGDISRGLVGSGIVYGGYEGAKNGLVNGSMKQDDFRGTMELQAAMKEAGIQPNSINTGNSNYTYDWAQPTAIPFSAGVNIANKDGLGLIEAMASGANTITDQSLLRGVSDFAGNFRQGGDLGEAFLKTASDMPASFTPGILNQVNQIADNNVRETYDPNPVVQGLNKVKSRIPGLAQTLPVRPNIKGENTERYQNGSNNILNVMFNPGFVRNKQNDPVLNKVVDLYKSTGETTQLMPIVKKSIEINGKQRKLSQNEYIKYQKLSGKLLYDKLKNTTFQNEEFNGLPESQQIKEIGNIQSDINAAIKYKLFGHRTKNGLDKYAQQYLEQIK